MKKYFFIIALAFFIGSAFCHVPVFFDNSNNNILDAYNISSPFDSIVYYSEIESFSSSYFSFSVNSLDRIHFSIITPDNEFYASVILMVPQPNGDYSLIFLNSSSEHLKEYEPFTPSGYYGLFDYDENANNSGTYYLIVNSFNSSGKFAIAFGYLESFSFIEWVKIPFDTLLIHSWEGQELLAILLPFLGCVLFGFFYESSKRKDIEFAKFAALISCYACIGSALMTIMQMIIGLCNASGYNLAFVTLIFIALEFICGFVPLKILHNKSAGNYDWLKLVILGIFGIAFWSGFVVFPLIIISYGIKLKIIAKKIKKAKK